MKSAFARSIAVCGCRIVAVKQCNGWCQIDSCHRIFHLTPLLLLTLSFTEHPTDPDRWRIALYKSSTVRIQLEVHCVLRGEKLEGMSANCVRPTRLADQQTRLNVRHFFPWCLCWWHSALPHCCCVNKSTRSTSDHISFLAWTYFIVESKEARVVSHHGGSGI